MMFSVLVPTRNRLEYLRHALQTVSRQRYDEWEVIVSDNASEQDIRGYVQSLNDSRVKYVRTPKFVPVTENWNFALDHSCGDYVIMLGDDDGLMPGYFDSVLGDIECFEQPDVVYTRALLFAHPGVVPSDPGGFVQLWNRAPFFGALPEPRLLARGEAEAAVAGSLDFRLRLEFNSQFSTLRRGFVEGLRRNGHFFHSPFPDFYATNAAFLRAQSVVVDPRPLTIIGITPKSYGFFHVNWRDDEGIEFLHGAGPGSFANDLLPGSRINTGWALAMLALQELHPEVIPRRVNLRRYRLLQILHAVRSRFIHRTMSAGEFREVWAEVRPLEKVTIGLIGSIGAIGLGLLPKRRRARLRAPLERLVGQYPEPEAPKIAGRYRDLAQVFNDSASILELIGDPAR